MKRLTTILICITLHASAREYNPHLSYTNRKTVGIGYSQTGISRRGIDELLTASGYPALPASVSTISLHVGSDFGPVWGVFYGADIGITEYAQGFDKKQLYFQYNRFYAGAEYTVIKKKKIELLGRVAFSISTASIRLYDTLADTSFTSYIHAHPDAKRIHTDIAGFDFGILLRYRVGIHTFIGIRSGYNLAIGSNTWSRDGGNLGAQPRTPLGTWYVGFQIGGLFHRRITRIPAEEFGEKPSS